MRQAPRKKRIQLYIQLIANFVLERGRKIKYFNVSIITIRLGPASISVAKWVPIFRVTPRFNFSSRSQLENFILFFKDLINWP